MRADDQHRRTCDYDDLAAVARIRWADGSACICEPHLRLVKGQEGVDVLPLDAAARDGQRATLRVIK